MGELCSSNKLTSTQLMTYNLFLYDKNFQTPGLKGCEKGKFSKRKSFSILEKNRRFGQKKKKRMQDIYREMNWHINKWWNMS